MKKVFYNVGVLLVVLGLVTLAGTACYHLWLWNKFVAYGTFLIFLGLFLGAFGMESKKPEVEEYE